MRDPAAVAFGLIRLVLSPVTLVGYGLCLGTLVLRGRRSGGTATAQGPLFDRWLRHHLGVRPDEAAARLLPAVPGVPVLGLRLVAAPTLLAHRLTGCVPAEFRPGREGHSFVGWRASRLPLFDAALERHEAAVQQLVILGAGFDTRAYGGRRLRAFEVDLPGIQAVKRAALGRAGVDPAGVTFVSADLGEPDWMDGLTRAGFEPGRPSLFLWEGVTMYLEREAVEAVLRRLAGTAAGSVVAFDYATSAALRSRSRSMRQARALARAVGEPLRGGLDHPGDLLASCGLTLLEQVRFGAWGGFVVAARAPAGAAGR